MAKNLATGLDVTYENNVVYIAQFETIPANTLVHIKIQKVTNPSNEGYNSNYFMVKSQRDITVGGTSQKTIVD